MHLAHPYGTGNHRRIAWRKGWDVDLVRLTATHRGSGFSLVFRPRLGVDAFEMKVAFPHPVFGHRAEHMQAQVDGLSELLRDGWDIFHTALARVARDKGALTG